MCIRDRRAPGQILASGRIRLREELTRDIGGEVAVDGVIKPLEHVPNESCQCGADRGLPATRTLNHSTPFKSRRAAFYSDGRGRTVRLRTVSCLLTSLLTSN